MESLEPRPDDQVERARGLLPEGFRVEARFAPPRPEVTPVRPAFPGSLPSDFGKAASTAAIMPVATASKSVRMIAAARSEERRVGKEWVSPCRSRWSRDH